MMLHTVWKLIFALSALIITLGLVLETYMPAAGRLFALAAIICALATWIVPILSSALFWYRDRSGWRPTSLASVGRSISLVVNAGIFSVLGFAFAIPPLLLATDRTWAWSALAIIAAFWLLGALGLYLFGGKSARSAERQPRNPE
jgi:hypothetical protein